MTRDASDAALEPRMYCAEDVLQRERERLFRTHWQFVAAREQLAQHGQWICAEVAGRSVVVQNFEGTLHAFHNVCAHRQSRLRQVGACGTGPLRCPYHGWTYDASGAATGIPSRREFDAQLARRGTPQLERWRVEQLGPLVFVNAAEDGESLQQYLGDMAQRVSTLADAAHAVVSSDQLTIAANWKAIIDNTLENYHVLHVHGATLQKHALKEIEIRTYGRHSASRFSAETSTRTLRAIDIAFPERPFVSSEYEHFLLFPNTIFTHVYGAFFMITRVDAKSPARSTFQSTIFTSRSGALTPEAESVRELLVRSNIAFIWQSYREDAPICEAVQLGLAETERRAIFGDRELRIAAFHAAYRERMHDAL